MKRLTTAATAIALSLAATAGFAGCDDGEIVVKFSHVTNTDKHPKGIAASLLEQRVNDEMNGKACMEVFPNSTLYNDDKVLEAMLSGDVQLAAPSLSKFEKFTKQFRLFDLPFMFKNIDAVDAFQNSDNGQAMLDSMQRRGRCLRRWRNRHQVQPRHQHRQAPQGHRRLAPARARERGNERQGLHGSVPELDPLQRRPGA